MFVFQFSIISFTFATAYHFQSPLTSIVTTIQTEKGWVNGARGRPRWPGMYKEGNICTRHRSGYGIRKDETLAYPRSALRKFDHTSTSTTPQYLSNQTTACYRSSQVGSRTGCYYILIVHMLNSSVVQVP